MLTPQEVSGHAFPKAVMGGYNMGSVDEFLDELTDDYTALYKENAVLKSKLKVLVEKVEDYRSTEDSMRATLLTAQKMADSIVREAETKRDQILAAAEKDARMKIGELQNEVVAAEGRLKTGQLELAKFIAGARAVCSKELEYLDQLPQLPVELSESAAEAPVPETEQNTVGEIEENIFATFGADTQKEGIPPEAVPEDPPSAPDLDNPPEAQREYPAGNPFEAEEAVDHDPTRRISLKDLKFGRNYSGPSDEDDD